MGMIREPLPTQPNVRLSVVCPSRLSVIPGSPFGERYLDRALHSVRYQTVWCDEWEIIVAVDPGNAVRTAPLMEGVRVVEAASPGQAASLNAGLAAARGDLLAIIEDDDVWQRWKIEQQVDLLLERPPGLRFVSASQMEMDPSGNYGRINDYPTPSTWLMDRKVWELVGPFDESYRWHIDTEWLGRLNRTRVNRVHMVDRHRPVREILMNIARHSALRETKTPTPLVLRTVNPNGGMSRIEVDPSARFESREEYRRMLAAFGTMPW